MRVCRGNMIFGIILFALLAGTAAASEEGTDASSEEERIIAYYFHGTNRCATCTRIEEWSYEAIRNSFPLALNEGTLLWNPVNTDKPENRHFIKDYALFTKSLVIVEMKGDKLVRWKNLNRVWELLGNHEKFSNYVTEEIGSYLGK